MYKYKDLDKICKKLCERYNLEYSSGSGFINGANFSWIIIDVRNGTTKVRTRLVITDWKFDKFIDCSKTIDVTTKSFDEIEKCLIESIKKFKECCVKDRLNEMEQDFEN